ncbi:hypothetical protein DsansV1_C18g0149071 [Dioscorea sansibarensis]
MHTSQTNLNIEAGKKHKIRLSPPQSSVTCAGRQKWLVQCLGIWDGSSNIAKPNNEESQRLEKKIEEVTVVAKGHVVTSAEEKICSRYKLQQICRFCLESISEFLSDNPFVNTPSLQQADECGLGSMQRHNILKKDPKYQQMERPVKAAAFNGFNHC